MKPTGTPRSRTVGVSARLKTATLPPAMPIDTSIVRSGAPTENQLLRLFGGASAG